MIEADIHEALAGEHVLGTLDADERAQAQSLLDSDPAFVRLVRVWERRLGELHAMVASVEPPAHLWPRIAARVAETSVAPADKTTAAPAAAEMGTVAGDRRLLRWRIATAVFAALAAALAAIVVTAAIAPGLLPPPLRPAPQIVEVALPVELPGRHVAALQRDATAPAFVLTVDVAHRTLMVRRITGEAESGKSYELWLVSDQFPGPRTLGVVGEGEFTPRSSLLGYDSATISNATYAISLEPRGGSPAGVPTGPILFTGKLIEAVPGE